MELEQSIAKATAQAVKSLYGIDVDADKIQIQKTKKEFQGDVTVVTFAFSKAAHKSPDAIGQEIGEYLKNNAKEVSDFNVIKGFLNISVAKTQWIDTLNKINKDDNFGIKSVEDNAPLVMIEYSSPNTNKPLHLGHVRNNLLGYSLSKIMTANGNKVVKTNIVNDRGIHICKSMLAWQKWGENITPEAARKKGDHLVGDFYVLFDKKYKEQVNELMAKGESEEEAKKNTPLIKEAQEMLRKWEAGDKEVRELWSMMNQWVYQGFDESYKRLGVAFDKIYYESDTYLVGKQKVEEGLAKGEFYKREDGSVWANLEKDGLDEKLLLRSDGTSVYMTQDIGTATLRFKEFPIDQMIYVVGNEQNYHFQVLSILLDRLGFKWGKSLVHFSYGMVELPNGKMKSREGTVVDADDLMDDMIATAKEMGKDRETESATEAELNEIARIVGLGALKYFILKVDPKKNMLFNPQESIDFNGNTGPFVQYSYTRAQSVLRKAKEAGIEVPNAIYPEALTSKELELIAQIEQLPVAIQNAGKAYSPALVANYAYEFAKVFNQFYHDCAILKEPDVQCRANRLLLCRLAAKVIKNALWTLGIEVPERM